MLTPLLAAALAFKQLLGLTPSGFAHEGLTPDGGFPEARLRPQVPEPAASPSVSKEPPPTLLLPGSAAVVLLAATSSSLETETGPSSIATKS
jgi:hypothetical protein